MKKIFYFVLILTAGIFSACSKKPNTKNQDTGNKPPTTLDLIKDSVYLYAREDYLWNNQLPDYGTFAPRGFKDPDDYTALSNELDALSQFAINPLTHQPYEYYPDAPGIAKYSFIDDGSVTAGINGTKGDFGFDYLYNLVNDIRVIFVYPGSPADIAGIKRGYQITKINNNADLSYDGPGFGSQTGVNANYVYNSIFNSGSIAMTIKKPDGTSFNVSFSLANYNVNPVLKYSVLDEGAGKKVGYVVFNSFTSDANADPKLNAAFSYFNTKGITDLVVDLRYNHGGYTSTAEFLDNLIVPAAKNNTLMYNTYFNGNLVNGKDPLLNNQWRKDPTNGQDYNYGQFSYTVADNAVKFQKKGTLSLSRVFFIMTGQTASASELTINNLRPNMDVQFIGEQSYGKPVGFFDININKYIMYTPEFSTKNSAGQGDYYAGFTPGDAGYPGLKDYDDITKDFGDPSEGLLSDIITYITTGTYAVHKQVIQDVRTKGKTFTMDEANKIAKSINRHKFHGMVFNGKLKLKN
jgi:carboxyl-terminal processing protease